MHAKPSVAELTSPALSLRHLRVGIVEGRQIVEERVVHAPKVITIGSSPGSTFITPAGSGPRQWRLFETRRGRLIVRLGPQMTARIAAGSTLSNFPVSEAEAVRSVVLPDGARGKVSLGETTVLFQRVRPAPPQPRPQLPVSVRRRLLADLDGPFAAIVAGVLLLHVALVVYLRHVDWPRRPSVDELPDRFVHQLLQRPRPVPVAPAPVKAPVAVDHRETPPARASRVAVASSPRPQPSSAERRAAIEDQVRHLGLLKVISAIGADGSARADLLAAGGVDRSVDDALKGVHGVAVAQDESLRNLPRITDGGGKVATVTGLRGGSEITTAAPLGPINERGVRTSIHIEPPSVEEGHVDPETIAREIRARRKALATCYERALKQQPMLAGKLVVRFTLTTAGTVGAVSIDEDTLGAPDVAACVRSLILRWRFPALPDGPAELSFPFVFQPGG